jgi:aspartate 1-decarboxylase
MLRILCKSKIRDLTITEACLHYEGSITIDEDLLDRADIWPNEQVHVLNADNGSRILTYAIPGPRGSGICCLNGPAARHGKPGECVTVLAYAHAEKPVPFRLVRVDARNRPLEMVPAGRSGS